MHTGEGRTYLALFLGTFMSVHHGGKPWRNTACCLAHRLVLNSPSTPQTTCSQGVVQPTVDWVLSGGQVLTDEATGLVIWEIPQLRLPS